MFYVLSGTARIQCDGQAFDAGPGGFVLLPLGLPPSPPFGGAQDVGPDLGFGGVGGGHDHLKLERHCLVKIKPV